MNQKWELKRCVPICSLNEQTGGDDVILNDHWAHPAMLVHEEQASTLPNRLWDITLSIPTESLYVPKGNADIWGSDAVGPNMFEAYLQPCSDTII